MPFSGANGISSNLFTVNQPNSRKQVNTSINFKENYNNIPQQSQQLNISGTNTSGQGTNGTLGDFRSP
jgi:hypothetical protein